MGAAAAYRAFAEYEVKGYSNTYFEWALSISEDPGVLTLIDELPVRSQQPNLIFAACRFLGVEPGPYRVLRNFLLTHWSLVAEVALRRRTQTNEPGRCAVLLPLLAMLPQPLALLEVGASAGLCLYPDRYSYVYDDDHRIDPAGGVSDVSLVCATRGDPPLPEALPDVVWRAGIDVAPLDVRDASSMKWLASLVWPEQEFRQHRLAAAIDIAKSDPPLLFEGDLVDRLAAVVARAPHEATLVVFHSAVLSYLDEGHRRDFEQQVRRLPATWISNEGSGVVFTHERERKVDQDNNPTPFVLSCDGRAVALAGAHGQSLDWW